MKTTKLTFFFDGRCPLCLCEVRQLLVFDTEQNLKMIDLYSNEFDAYKNCIDQYSALRVLHGLTEKGELILGLDVTYQAWNIVGKGRWFAPLKWRWLRPLLNIAYGLFAKNREVISLFLTGKRTCSSCSISSSYDHASENKTGLNNHE